MRSGQFAGLLCCLLALGGLPILVHAEDPSPAPQLGDVAQSPQYALDYCRQLAARVESAAEQQPDRSADVADLIREGKAQCAAGHIRSGLHRLRVALVTLRGG